VSEALYTIPAADLWGILPELILTGAGVLILLLDAFFKNAGRLAVPVGVLSILTAAFHRWDWSPRSTSFGGLLESGPLTTAIGLVVLLAALLALLASAGYLKRQNLRAAEYTVLLLWCGAGLLLMARATELLTLFVALELLSICLYTLAAYHRRLTVSLEAGIKYFLMGAFVSAFILLGIALLYGETGTTNLRVIAEAGPRLAGASFLGSVGLLFLICGFGFKMSVAPFHAWSPDTYQGAPSPFVAFLSVAPKAASAVVLLRLLELVPAHGLEGRWPQLIIALSVLSMVVGNVLALAQRDLKRMLAYSGIAHMGYLLVPLVETDRVGYEAVIIYILAYALMNAGAFSVVTLFYANPGEQHLISDLGGWGYRFPLLGVCLTVCLLSLGGIPPTLGFIGKYLVFLYALEEGYLWLALVVVATSLIGVFYYLRVVYTLYMRPQVRETDGLGIDLWGRVAAVVAALGSLALGIWPAQVLEWASHAVRVAF
jgi:NADH-quinone oxidoreductase subunit N